MSSGRVFNWFYDALVLPRNSHTSYYVHFHQFATSIIRQANPHRCLVHFYSFDSACFSKPIVEILTSTLRLLSRLAQDIFTGAEYQDLGLADGAVEECNTRIQCGIR